MTLTKTNLSTETLRSIIFSALQSADDRLTIVSFCENFTASDFIECTGIAENTDPAAVAEAFAFVRADFDKGEFDLDDYDTSDSEFGDFTDLFAGMDDLYEMMYEMRCVAMLSDSMDDIKFDTPSHEEEEYQGGRSPQWQDFLCDYEGAAYIKDVCTVETNRFNSIEQTRFVFCLPSDIKQLEADCETWAEQFVQKYTLTCSYMGETQETTDLTVQDLTEDPDWSSWGDELGKCDGDQMVDVWGNTQTDPRRWATDSATEKNVGPWRYHGIGQEQFDWCNTLLARAAMKPLTKIAGDWQETFDENGVNETQLNALDNAEWEIEAL